MDYSALKSGTDVRGTALDICGGKVNLTDEAVKDIAAAFGVWLSKRTTGKTVAVGGDSRLSTPKIKGLVAEELKKSGFTVLDCGLCSTPSMFMVTQFEQTKADASVMITASHHPSDKNGLKFFLPSGGLSGSQISEILQLAEKGEKCKATEGEIKKDDYMVHYCSFLLKKVRDALGEEKPLDGFKIVVDAGNGAGAFFVERVLKPLGANTDGSQFLDPDGSFPNHIPNPENAEAMQAIRTATLNANADLGIIFDTDVDRAAVVGADGREINRNALIALMSAIVLKENIGATIVTDSVTSDGLKAFIKERGGIHHRYKRGYRNVIDEAIRLCDNGQDAPLAIETSGHAAMKENYFLDDGAYLVTRIIIEAARLKKEGKSVLSLIDGLKEAAEEIEVRLSFSTEQWKELGAFVIESLKNIKAKGYIVADDNHEGVRVSIPAFKGWFLVRMSVHDPIMPVNIEADEKGGAKEIARLLYAYLKEFSGLNTDNLRKIIE